MDNALYVALGDSYAAGEGLGGFEGKPVDTANAPHRKTPQADNTNTKKNECHRSQKNAYAVYRRDSKWVVRNEATPKDRRAFYACSGATSLDMMFDVGTREIKDGGFQYMQPKQTDVGGTDTKWVSVSAGGNDAQFGKIGRACAAAVGTLPGGHQTAKRLPGEPACKTTLQTVSKNILDKPAAPGDEGYQAACASKLSLLACRLRSLYRAILTRSPSARLAVMGYPRIFPADAANGKALTGSPEELKAAGLPEDATSLCVTNSLGYGIRAEIGVTNIDLPLVNGVTDKINRGAQDAVKDLQRAGFSKRLGYVDTNATAVTHDCDGRTDDVSVNGLMLTPGAAACIVRYLRDRDTCFDPRTAISSATFHPTKKGQERFADALEAFFASPPTDEGGGTTTPPAPPTPTGPIGAAAGDPHLATFDQVLYDMQAEGEFQLAASTVDDFAVQMRTRLTGRVSVVDEVAVRTPTRQLVVFDNSGVHVDGVAVTSGDVLQLTDGGTVDGSAVRLGDGTTVFAGGSARVHLASARAGHMRGMLGDGDGAPANDGLTVDGRQILGPKALDGLSPDQAAALLYDDFSAGWVVPDSERLFAGDRRPFVKPPIPQPFAGYSAAQIADAKQLCSSKGWVEPELSLCVYDVLVTGDPKFAEPGFRLGAKAGATSTGGEPSLVRDADGDGEPAETDCNDSNASIYPGAPETADDGIDQDCNGTDLVTAAPQVITFDALADVPYGTTPITLTATASSGLAVAYVATGPCSVSGAVLTLSGVGTCSITASQAGTAQFLPATPVLRSLIVTKAGTRVTARALVVSVILQSRSAIATLTSVVTGNPIAGQMMTLRTGGGGKGQSKMTTICTASTDDSGIVRCAMSPRVQRAALKTGSFSATYAGSERYEGSTDSASVCWGLGTFAPGCRRSGDR